MRVEKCIDKSIQDGIQEIVNKHRALCIGVTLNEEDIYECVIYNNGVKLIVGSDELLLMSIAKAFEPILKQRKNGKITIDSKPTEAQMNHIKKTLWRLKIDRPSCYMIAPEGITPSFFNQS